VLALTSGLGAIEQEIRAESRAAAQSYGMTLIEAFAESPSQLTSLIERCAQEHCEALVPCAIWCQGQASIAVLLGLASESDARIGQIQEAARALGRHVELVRASSDREFNVAFANIVQRRAGALFIDADPLFVIQRTQLVTLAAKHAIPASYAFRELVESAGRTPPRN
jgi:hypothetical protein